MRGGSFGEDVDPTGANLPALKGAFFEALRALEERLSVTPGPSFEEEFGVLLCRQARLVCVGTAWVLPMDRRRLARRDDFRPAQAEELIGRGWPKLGAA